MVEFMLVAPVLLIILVAVLQFGIVLHDFISVTNAADTAARKVSVTATQSNAQDVVLAAARGAAPDLSQDRMQVIVSPGSPWAHAQDVTVTVTYPYSISILGIVISSGNLKGSTTARVW
jgi:Flp pilus assembly protein TadG